MDSGFLLGLDLGQAVDASALAVLEKQMVEGVRHYFCRALRRWELGTKYTKIVEDVGRVVDREPLARLVPTKNAWNVWRDEPARSTLVIDGTGVGRPVVDMFAQARPNAYVRPVMITTGRNESYKDGYFHVPKSILVSTVVALLEQERLKFAPTIKEAATLIKEMRDYRVKVTDSANETFAAREGANDDLIMAVAIACWFGERCQKRLEMRF